MREYFQPDDRVFLPFFPLFTVSKVGQMGGKVWKELKYTQTRKKNTRERLSKVQAVRKHLTSSP